MNIKKIAIVGPPRSGKTTIISKLKFKNSGGIFIPEAAQIYFQNRLQSIWEKDDVLVRQDTLLRTQLFAEYIAEETAKSFMPENYVIITDRGIADAYCYLSHDEANQILAATNCQENHYDLAILLLPPEKRCDGDMGTVRIENMQDKEDDIAKRTLDIWSSTRFAKEIIKVGSYPTIDEKTEMVCKVINKYCGYDLIYWG